MSHRREHGYMPMTIERWLKNYADAENHIKRHETLWHEWNHNKQWLSHIQELILPSFPSYSRHGLSHSEAVIRNIEMLLGEANIKSLSPTDCFALLHTVYIHDIGMCITYADRKDILRNERFHDFLREIRQSAHDDMVKYADCLLKVCFDEPEHMDDEERLDYILEQKLDIFYAVTYLFAEYRRIEHGNISRKRLEEWIGEPSKLGAGFSTMEIPNRIFFAIAECAEAHAKWEFDAILKLPSEDTGYVLDYLHPRFIAVLLQLGDALDMDNDRFHPLVKEYLGGLPTMSELHYGKHKAIRRLHITNQKISISADCQNQGELRLVRMECDNIQNIIENASYHWAVIRPRHSKISLPTLDRVEIFLKGNLIPSQLITARFEISQDKAFKLLQGNNFYKDSNFVFLRELLQNAVDATKLQYYQAYCGNGNYNDKAHERNPADVARLVSPLNYPIEIEFRIVRMKNGKYIDFSEDYQLEAGEKKPDCGVLVKIKDCGTGIRAKEIEQIIDVGSSHERRKNVVRKMPKWLQPTGVFGIGLQSVFLACDRLRATTYAHNEEKYEITFYPRVNGNRGYVNVMPLESEEQIIPYGTCFELFVKNDKRRSHEDSPETWIGTDPFESQYDQKSDIRHARELIKQMSLYLADIVGEPLFPITLKIFDPLLKKEQLDIDYDDPFRKKFVNLGLEIYGNEDQNWGRLASCGANIDGRKISWAYNIEKNETKIYFDHGNAFFLDEKEAKLYIWNSQHNAYARLGVDRIIAMREKFKRSGKGDDLYEQMRVYYKGILLSKVNFRDDANLIEYIDLKGTMDSDYLKLNRNGLSPDGYQYVESVYKDIVNSTKEALHHFGKRDPFDGKESIYIEELEKHIEKTVNFLKDDNIQKTEDDIECAEKYFLSVTVLAYFAIIEKREDYLPTLREDNLESWNHLLRKMASSIREFKERNTDEKDVCSYWKFSFLHNLPTWRMGEDQDNFPTDIIEFIDGDNKYAILSVRKGKSKEWSEYLIKLDGELYGEKLLENIQAVKDEDNCKKKFKMEQEIHKIVDPFFNIDFRESLNITLESERKSHLILKWMLMNIPTIALFSSLDGNARLNILDSGFTGSTYLDINMKKLTMERMIEIYQRDHIQRFGTIVWSGYHFLKVNDWPSSVLYIKRGKFSDGNNDKMIFPLSGAELKDLFEECDRCLKPILDVIESLYTNIIKGVYQYLRIELSQRPDGEALDGRFWTLVEQGLFSEDYQNKTEGFTLEVLERKSEMCSLTKEDQENVVHRLLASENVTEGNEAFTKFNNACKIIGRAIQYYACMAISEYNLSKYEKTSVFERMVQYVSAHSMIYLSEDQVKNFYHKYICECMFAYMSWIKRHQFENYNSMLKKFLEHMLEQY